MNFKEERILASLINDQGFNPMTATDILDGKARIGGSEYDSPGLEERELRLRMAQLRLHSSSFFFPFPLSLFRSHQPNDSAPVVAFPERRAP